jgi:hemoglobin-like flavoprotein
MNASDVALVQDSFKKVAPIADVAAELFYGRLFEVAPQVKPMFKGDMKEQGRKLMATLGVVVTGLTRLETVLPAASALAKQHVAYGVKAEHSDRWRCAAVDPRKGPGRCLES